MWSLMIVHHYYAALVSDTISITDPFKTKGFLYIFKNQSKVNLSISDK